MPKQPREPPKPPPSASTEIDRALAASAREKRQSGQQPTAKEMSALRRTEKAEEEAQRWDYYRTIPQKHWREMGGGWQTKMLQEQAERYGIPFSGRLIDLPAVVLALRKFLAANAQRLSAADSTDDPMMSGDGKETPAMRRYREARANLTELEYERQIGKLVPLDKINARVARILGGLRRAGEVMQRKYGAEVQQVLDDALDEAEREFFGDTPSVEE